TGSHWMTHGEHTVNPLETIQRTTQKTAAELVEASKLFATKLRGGHSIYSYLLPAVGIEVEDLGIRTWLDPARRLSVLPAASPHPAHLSCHSSALYQLFTKVYGVDAFAVGAHFRTRETGKGRLIALIAAGLLVENKLDVKSLSRGLFTGEGRAFLWNRREE